MKFHDDFLAILNIKKVEEDLILRLDISEWFSLETYRDVVLEVTLISCKNAQKSFETLEKNIGELIWSYEFLSDEKVFNILLDDGDSIKIKCLEISEKKCDLTIDELVLKFQYLAKSYQQESESSSKGWSKYRTITELLKKEIGREIQNWERKELFFEQNNSESAEKAKTIIKVYNRMLNFIGQIEIEKK